MVRCLGAVEGSLEANQNSRVGISKVSRRVPVFACQQRWDYTYENDRDI
jgi:hypothetical protein